MMEAFGLRVEYKKNPIGIDVALPRFCWKIRSDRRETMQTGYRVQVSPARDGFENVVWDSGLQESDQSIHIVYEGSELGSRQRYEWRVKVWDNHGRESDWSGPAWFEMGLLAPADWKAEMVRPDLEEDPERSNPCPMLRKEFELTGEIESARLYIAARGLYEAWINGRRVGEDLFTPGWTTYEKCLQYQTYDVTDPLSSGTNAIGVLLSDGWFRGHLSPMNLRNMYGEKLGLLAQLEVRYKDGTGQTLVSDNAWRADTGPIREADFFNGEVYDARMERPGWNHPGFDDSGWHGVIPVDFDLKTLAAPVGVPVRKMEEIRPGAILETPAGETVVDFGQNLSGWARLTAAGPPGTAITMRYGEVLDREGNFYNKNLRHAKSRDVFLLKGEEEETYEPRFTFHGFRYVKVENYPGRLEPEHITAVAVYSDCEITADFDSSNPLLNRLFSNIVWSQKGNFVDLPTDCPQRDERMGWTGDILVYGPTACHVMMSGAFLTRWLRDLKNDQREDGLVPFIVPDPFSDLKVMRRKLIRRMREEKLSLVTFVDLSFAFHFVREAAGWIDAAIFAPWTLYLYYGDTRILETHYESMKALFSFREHRAKHLGSLLYVNPLKWFQPKTWKHITRFLTTSWHFGDWLAPGDGMNRSIVKSKLYLPTVFFAFDALLLSRIAEILGKGDDAALYRRRYEEIKEAYQHFRVKKSGRLWPDRQTHYVLALLAGLMPEEARGDAVENLVRLVRGAENRIDTGFLGTPFLCHILAENGHPDVAYDLLLQTEAPSWLYQVTKGATTIWEHWDAIREDGSFHSERMLSFNHYAYGAIGLFLLEKIAGVGVDEKKPGYKHVLIRPMPGGDLKNARASYDSIHGRILSEWEISSRSFVLRVEIPANVRATVVFPGSYAREVTENGTVVPLRDGATEVGSGSYVFECKA